MMNWTGVIIYDSVKDEAYQANSPDECRDSTDRSAYAEAIKGQTIQMGCITARPIGDPKP